MSKNNWKQISIKFSILKKIVKKYHQLSSFLTPDERELLEPLCEVFERPVARGELPHDDAVYNYLEFLELVGFVTLSRVESNLIIRYNEDSFHAIKKNAGVYYAINTLNLADTNVFYAKALRP